MLELKYASKAAAAIAFEAVIGSRSSQGSSDMLLRLTHSSVMLLELDRNNRWTAMTAT